MSTIPNLKSSFWTTGKFAPGYVPTPKENQVGLARTIRIYEKSMDAASSARRLGPGPPPGMMDNNRKCTKVQPCGHPCYDFLWQDGGGCSPCRVPKTVNRADCGHQTTVYCSSGIPGSKCTATCTRMLDCGHQCTKQCGLPCVVDCRHRDCWKNRREKDEEARKASGASDSNIETTNYDDEEW